MRYFIEKKILGCEGSVLYAHHFYSYEGEDGKGP